MGVDPEDKAEEDRKKLEEGLLGYALVQVVYEDKPTETHAWGEVNLREGDPKHITNIVNSIKAAGRQDWENPMTVTVDEDMVDLSTIVSSPVPYANVPVLRFKEEAMAQIINFLNGFHRFKANRQIYRGLKGPLRGSRTPLGACQTLKTSGYARPLAYPRVFDSTMDHLH